MNQYEYPVEPTQEWFTKIWLELDEDMRKRIVAHLLDKLPGNFLLEVKEMIEEDPEDWAVKPTFIQEDEFNIPYIFHTGPGMGVCNLLRDLYRDDELPTNNWDDFYVQALEEAVKDL